ncbi:unnamed protein product [Phytomonas sp. EM1]|nr:unnamed protein product [Phytomonas sp. EM1]|eukprot:CCW62013.1 unnamed protein product [Phytomonas sp. isolate EM1]
MDLVSSVRLPSVFAPKEHFEKEQYVRVCFPNGRVEIGAVMGISDDFITVYTTQGYDINVPRHFVKRAFLLVLDLNGVLVARGRGCFLHRPHVKEFLKFAFSNFVVAVWTSGLERSSNLIIESVFDGYQDRLLFKLYRDACVPRPTEESPFGTLKDLQKVFDAYPKSFHSVNTIIVDDSPCKCSHPDIALCPIPFKDANAQREDDGLLEAIETLQEVLDSDSHAPLIRAAEGRLARLARQEQVEESCLPMSGAGGCPPTQSEAGVSRPGAERGGGPEDRGVQLEQVNLWKSRLCCQHLRGCCRHENCRFSHDPDDGKRACSSKNYCMHGHASRWVTTVADVAIEFERRASDETHHFWRRRGRGARRTS